MKKIVFFCMWLVSVCLCACSGNDGEVILIGNEESVTAEESLGVGSEGDSDEKGTILVYVCGAVTSPGVVEIPKDSRVEDALEAAGGFSESAERTCVNLADWVEDGQMLYFPTIEEVASDASIILQEQWQTGFMKTPISADGLVNINTADVTLLCTLPGIGESRAEDIIAYRQENGLFQKCEDIMCVPGIKAGIYEKICHKITVD